MTPPQSQAQPEDRTPFDVALRVSREMEGGEAFVRALSEQEEAQAPVSDLPPIVSAKDFSEREIPVPPEIVHGLLHQGSKLIYGGPSKAYKTWTLLDMGFAVATGLDWLGFCTTRSRVLYVNFELQEFGIHRRLRAIAMDRRVGVPGGLHLWNLRGRSAPLTRLLPELLRRIDGEGYGLIIPDPIYKTLQGRDENNAGDIGAVCNEIESLAVKTGAAVAFGAHYAKGNAAAKQAIDRISGSGVFARDPDAIVTATQHEEEDCFAVNMVLRNFPPQPDFTIRWRFPRMVRDETLDPQDLRQPAAPKKKPRPPVDTLFEQAMALFGDGPLRAGMFQDLATPIAGSRDRCRELRARLVQAGRLACHHVRQRATHESWLGTPDQIEEIRRASSKV